MTTMLPIVVTMQSSTRSGCATRSWWPRSSSPPRWIRWARTCSTPAFPTRRAALSWASIHSARATPLSLAALFTDFCPSATICSNAGVRSSGARDLLTTLKAWSSSSRKCRAVLMRCSSRVRQLPTWRISSHAWGGQWWRSSLCPTCSTGSVHYQSTETALLFHSWRILLTETPLTPHSAHCYGDRLMHSITSIYVQLKEAARDKYGTMSIAAQFWPPVSSCKD